MKESEFEQSFSFLLLKKMKQSELKAIHRKHLWEDIKKLISYYETHIWIIAGAIALIGLMVLENYLLDKFFQICFGG